MKFLKRTRDYNAFTDYICFMFGDCMKKYVKINCKKRGRVILVAVIKLIFVPTY